MNQYTYFNPHIETHSELLSFLEQHIDGEKNKVDMYKFGENTQHIFTNNKYLMTINWNLL